MELIFLVLVFATIYFLNLYFLNYWSRQNVPQIPPQFLLGNLKEMLRNSTSEGFKRFYDEYKGHRFIGFYMFYQPLMLINDPELIQSVLISDFKNFHDRLSPGVVESDPFNENLFSLTGQMWRDLRAKLTPVFSSVKLKFMLPSFLDCSRVLIKFIEQKNDKGENIFEIRDLISRFSINIISSVAFGVENDCINEPDNVFRTVGMKIFDRGFIQRIKWGFFVLLPRLFPFFKIHLSSKEVEDFITSLMRQTINYREKNEVKKNDFMDLMIQLKNKGFISTDKMNENFSDTTKLTEKTLIAQAFTFFTAGEKN